MVRVCNETEDLRLEPSAQKALSQSSEDQTEFSVLQSDLLKILLTQNWKMSLECFQIVAQDTQGGNLSATTAVSEFEYKMGETFMK